MNAIFELVENVLRCISIITGLTYKEINIIVYYIIIPFSWMILIDKILKFHYLKIIYGLATIFTLVVIKDFSIFSDWLFLKSVAFLRFFGDYTVSSVMICVFLVILIYLILIYLAFFHKKHIISKIFDFDNY